MKKPMAQDGSEVFGIIDDALDQMERAHPRAKKVAQIKDRKALPRMQIVRRETPPELSKVEAGNVVYVPESVLKQLSYRIENETGKLNRLLLRKLMPLLLSYQTATNYTKAAIKDGLDVEVDFDPGLLDCVRHIGYLNVVMHFIRNSKLPLVVKKRFMRKFSDSLADQAILAMVAENRADVKRTQMQELQAVIYSHNKKKAEVKTREVEPAPSKPVGTKRPRRQRG